MPITLLAGWPERLAEFIESRRHVPFSWGGSDCTLFAADAVKTMTGHDFAANHRGTYDNARSALRLIESAGGLTAFITIPEIERKRAGRGDVVLLDESGRGTLGIHLGHAIAAQGADGIVFLPPGVMLRAWTVRA